MSLLNHFTALYELSKSESLYESDRVNVQVINSHPVTRHSDAAERFLPTARRFPAFRKGSCQQREGFRRSGKVPANSAEVSGVPERFLPSAQRLSPSQEDVCQIDFSNDGIPVSS